MNHWQISVVEEESNTLRYDATGKLLRCQCHGFALHAFPPSLHRPGFASCSGQQLINSHFSLSSYSVLPCTVNKHSHLNLVRILHLHSSGARAAAAPCQAIIYQLVTDPFSYMVPQRVYSFFLYK